MTIDNWINVIDIFVSFAEVIVMGVLTYWVYKLNKATFELSQADRLAKEREQEQIKREKRMNLIKRLEYFYLEESPGYLVGSGRNFEAFRRALSFNEEDLVPFLNQEERDAIYKIRHRLEAHLNDPYAQHGEGIRQAAIDLANMTAKAIELIERNTKKDS